MVMAKKNKKCNDENDDTTTLKIPSAWKTQRSQPNDFVMISPQSDISNPSHFRGLFVAPPTKLTTTQPPTLMTTTTTKHHHHRMSKVLTKLSSPPPPPFIKQKLYSHTTRRSSAYHPQVIPPIPARFYFQGHDVDDDEDDDVVDVPNQEQEKAPGKEEEEKNVKERFNTITPYKDIKKVNTEVFNNAATTANKVSNTIFAKTTTNQDKKIKESKKNRTVIPSKFTRKCIKAKVALSECWKDHVLSNEDTAPPPPVHVQRHYSQREIITKQQQQQQTKNQPYAPLSLNNNNTSSFQPVWKETNMILSSSTHDSSDQNIKTKTKEYVYEKENKVIAGAHTFSKENMVVPTGHVQHIVRTFSQDTYTTVGPHSKATTGGYSHDTSAASTIVQKYPPYSKQQPSQEIGRAHV